MNICRSGLVVPTISRVCFKNDIILAQSRYGIKVSGEKSVPHKINEASVQKKTRKDWGERYKVPEERGRKESDYHALRMKGVGTTKKIGPGGPNVPLVRLQGLFLSIVADRLCR